MKKYVLKTINNEEIYKNDSNFNITSNIIGKSINLTSMSVVVDEIIAQGGYGIVFKAHNSSQNFALKKMVVNSVPKLLNCIREIFILKKIKSENIMSFLDSIVYQSAADIYHVFILTDLYRGNLSSMMRTMRSSHRIFEEPMVLHILSHVSRAVASLHQSVPSPIVHRDLKVENVLIAYPQRYVLCDFGSATLKEVKPCLVNKQELQEDISQSTTLSYRSPEMTDLYFDGGEHIIGRKADIWALGVLVYNICFFTLPFGESVLSIMSGNFTVPDSHPYSNELMKLIKLCLTTDPDLRPDIYQLSTIIFALLFEPNPIKNTENSSELCLDNISLPTKESDAKLFNSSQTPRDRTANVSIVPKPISTSIKPRERPKRNDYLKPISARPTQSNSSSHNNLTLLQSQDAQNEDWFKNQSSISVLTDNVESRSPHASPKDDLIDFNGISNRQIAKLGKVSKSQSLGKHFSPAGPGQYWNVHQMISQSYQNVQGAPLQLYPNTPPNNQTMNFNNNANVANLSQYYPVNHTNAYLRGLNIGHRRLGSEPVGYFSATAYSCGQINNLPSNMSVSQGILQPSKSTVPLKRESVLNEFDPLGT